MSDEHPSPLPCALILDISFLRTIGGTDTSQYQTEGSQISRKPQNTIFCIYKVFCMPSITVNVDDDLKDRMENHPEINWSEVTRQAIQEKIETLEVMDELTSQSNLTESDVTEIADRINKSGRERVEEQSN